MLFFAVVLGRSPFYVTHDGLNPPQGFSLDFLACFLRIGLTFVYSLSIPFFLFRVFSILFETHPPNSLSLHVCMSKVPGAEGSLWAADPTVYPGSLREVFKKDFAVYGAVERFARATGNFFTLQWAPWKVLRARG